MCSIAGSGASGRYEVLDAWRGICTCLVALFHFKASFPNASWAVIRNGYLCVDFFFVLSGFVIASSYLGKIRCWRDAHRLVLLRIGRLYPLHLFTLAVLIAYQLAQLLNGSNHPQPMPTFKGEFLPAALVSNFLLVHSLHLHDLLTWNVPSWSISTEPGPTSPLRLSRWASGCAPGCL